MKTWQYSWVGREAQGVWAPPFHLLLSFSKRFSQRARGGGGQEVEKKNELESHFLITVPGEWKTEFPSWSNDSLVFLMKPNQARFQRLVDVSEASPPRVPGSERKYVLMSWSFLIIIYYHFVPRKIFAVFLTWMEKARGT